MRTASEWPVHTRPIHLRFLLPIILGFSNSLTLPLPLPLRIGLNTRHVAPLSNMTPSKYSAVRTGSFERFARYRSMSGWRNLRSTSRVTSRMRMSLACSVLVRNQQRGLVRPWYTQSIVVIVLLVLRPTTIAGPSILIRLFLCFPFSVVNSARSMAFFPKSLCRLPLGSLTAFSGLTLQVE